jgi:hypothetical protein
MGAVTDMKKILPFFLFIMCLGSLCFADQLTPNLGLDLVPISPYDVWGQKVDNNFSLLDTAVAGKQPSLGIVTPGMYGTLSTLADNSLTLQDAWAGALETGACLWVPNGSWNYATTLQGASGSTGGCLIGVNGSGSGATVLNYTGTGTMVNFSNSGSPVYNPTLRNIAFQGSNNPSEGIVCNTCSESQWENVTVTGTVSGSTVTSRVGIPIDLTNSSGVNIHHPIIEYSTNGILFNKTTALAIDNGDFYGLTGSAFKFTGSASDVDIHDNWVESIDYFANIDDTGASGTTEITGLRIRHNHLLFNGGTTTYPDQIALGINNGQNNLFIASGITFEGNDDLMAGGSSNTGYPIVLTFNSPNASSFMAVEVVDNWFNGATTGLDSTNSTQQVVTLRDNKNYSASLTPLAVDHSGSGYASCEKTQTDGTRVIGCNAGTTGGSTLRLFNGTATSGITNETIQAGAGQSTNPPFQVFSNGGSQIAAIGSNGAGIFTELLLTGSGYAGSITLSGGTGTSGCVSGCRPSCTDTNASAAYAVSCSVSGTTLTAHGNGSDVINWFCF